VKENVIGANVVGDDKGSTSVFGSAVFILGSIFRIEVCE